jgi:hypothetical protein
MKNSQLIKIPVLIGLFTALFFACAKDEGPFIKKTPSVPVTDTLPNNNDTVITIPEPTVYTYSIGFSTHVKPIFQASCIMGCHNSNHPYLDLRPPVAYNELLTTGASAPYVNTGMPKLSVIYKHLVGIYTLMPKGGPKLPQGKIDTVYTWISQGALNN